MAAFERQSLELVPRRDGALDAERAPRRGTRSRLRRRGARFVGCALRVGVLATWVGACGARTDLRDGADNTPLGKSSPPYEFVAAPDEPLAVVATPLDEPPARRTPPRRPGQAQPPTEPPREPTTRPPTRPIDEPPVDEPPADGEEEEEEVPEECRLAPVDPDLPDETFEVLGTLVSEDYAPAEAERWNWTGQSDEQPAWPYPARAVWPEQVPLPEDSEDFEYVALAGSSADDLYVVGQRVEQPLVWHLHGGSWTDESAAVLAALPEASEANSVSVAKDGQVWLSTREGLLRSSGDGQWTALPVSNALLPLGAAWLDEQGFGVVAGGSVATTLDAGGVWSLETRTLGFVAPGMAYSRSFVRVAGRTGNVAVVGAYGHLLTRDEQGWKASTLLASDVAFTESGQFVTTRRPSAGLFFREAGDAWKIYPVSLDSRGFRGRGALDRVWASPSGEVFAGGGIYAVLHRFADGTLELLPSQVNDLLDFYASSSRLFTLTENSLFSYELGDVTSSGAAQAAVLDDALLDIVPDAESAWGQRAASNFEPLDCVDEGLRAAGAPAFQGELGARAPVERYGSCSYGAERFYSEMAFSFTAPVTGSYRIVLDEVGRDADDSRVLQLALRNGCEGWLIWGDGRGGSSYAVDIGLEQSQVLLIEVYASQELSAPVPFELSIY